MISVRYHPDLLLRSHRLLDLILVAAALCVSAMILVRAFPDLRGGNFGYSPVLSGENAIEDGYAPLYVAPGVQCVDHTTELAERRWVYDQIDRKFSSDAFRVLTELDVRIVDDYAIADPSRYWTVAIGQRCGETVAMDAETIYSVDRSTGRVGEGVWVMFAFGGAQPYWRKEQGIWREQTGLEIER